MEVAAQHPTFYLQVASGTHTITLRANASGRNPVVAEQRISEEFLAYILSLEEDEIPSAMFEGGDCRIGRLFGGHVFTGKRRVGG